MFEILIEKVCYLLQADRITALIVLICAAALVVLCLLAWVISAVGLMVMARRRGVRGCWMGWFPFLNIILLGRIHDCYLSEVKNLSTDRRHSLPVLSVAMLLSVLAAVGLWLVQSRIPAYSDVVIVVAMVVSACAVVLAIVLLVQIYTTCYNIYYSCTPDDAALLTTLMVLNPVLIPFFIFGLRKKANGMPPKRIHFMK